MKKPVRILIVAILLAACVGLFYWHINRDNPFFGFLVGGFPPTYQPQPHDHRLEIIADYARPTIAKIEEFHQKQGRYPFTASEIKQIIPDNTIEGVYYRPSDEKALGYSLSIRLGWDTSMGYSHNVSGTGWTFLPGDGSPDIPVDL